jgi:nucleoid DNA-binding protein
MTEGVFKAVLRLTLNGVAVRIPDFGTFEIVTLKPKRVTTNGVVREVPARRVLRFRACKALRNIEGGE